MRPPTQVGCPLPGPLSTPHTVQHAPKFSDQRYADLLALVDALRADGATQVQADGFAVVFDGPRLPESVVYEGDLDGDPVQEAREALRERLRLEYGSSG